MHPRNKSKTKNHAKNNLSSNSSQTGTAVLCTLCLIALAIAILFLSSFFLPRMKFISDMRAGDIFPGAHPPGAALFTGPELGNYLLLRTVLSSINVILVVYLLFVYVKDYLRFKTGFALGIVAFLFSFLLYALSSFPLFYSFFGPRGFVEMFSFIPLLFSALGLLIFVKLSNE